MAIETQLHISAEQFESTINNGVAVVDFYAEWCNPCKMLAPIIEDLAKTYEGKANVVKLNVDEAQDIAEQYGVMSIPTVIVFKDGEEKQRLMGFHPIDDLKQAIDNFID